MSDTRLRPRRPNPEGGPPLATVAGLTPPHRWVTLENATGVCFATAALEVLLRCRSLWRFYAWRTPTGEPFQPKTECLGRLRLLFHALTRGADRTADLVHAFLSQEAFAAFTTEEYRRNPTGSDDTTMVLQTLKLCLPDVGRGAFMAVAPTSTGVFPMGFVMTVDDQKPPETPLVSPPLALVVSHRDRPTTLLPATTLVMGGLTYHWVGTTLFHPPRPTGPPDVGHATALVADESRTSATGFLHKFGESPEAAAAGFDSVDALREGQTIYPSFSLYELDRDHFLPDTLYARVFADPLFGPPASMGAPGTLTQLSLMETIARYARLVLWRLIVTAPCPDDPSHGETSKELFGPLIRLDLRPGPAPASADGYLLGPTREMGASMPPLWCSTCHAGARVSDVRISRPRLALVVSPVATSAPPPTLELAEATYTFVALCARRRGEGTLSLLHAGDREIERQTCGIPHFYVYRREGP